MSRPVYELLYFYKLPNYTKLHQNLQIQPRCYKWLSANYGVKEFYVKLSKLARLGVLLFMLMGFCLLVCDTMSFGKSHVGNIFQLPHKPWQRGPVVSIRYLATF